MNQFKTRDLLVCIQPAIRPNRFNPEMHALHDSEVGGGRCVPPSKDKNRGENDRCVAPSKGKQLLCADSANQMANKSNAAALQSLKQAIAKLQQTGQQPANA